MSATTRVDNGYYTCFRGQQIPLAKGPNDKLTGPVYLAAQKKYTDLTETANADKADQGNTVRLVCELYGQHLESDGRTSTLRIMRDTLKSGLDRFGDMTLNEFKVIRVTKWPHSRVRGPVALGQRGLRPGSPRTAAAARRG